MTLERSLLKRIVEAALFASGQPMSLEKLGELFYEEERPSVDAFREVLAELETEYSERGVQLKEVATGYRFQACAGVGEWVSRLWEEKPQRYSRALLETLALIAYRQPITRGEVEDIRGVSVSSHIIKTLLEREWVRVLGYRDVPGRPAMYGTTKSFLDYFNLRSLEELPTLAEVRDLDKISAELDERLQLSQPQASLPLDPTPAEPVSDSTTPPAETSHVGDENASHVADENPASAEVSSTDAGMQVDTVESVEVDSTEAVIAETAENTAATEQPPVEPSAKSPSLLQNVLLKARSLFADAPSEPVATPATQALPSTATPATQALQLAVADDETPPSPIDSNDPRLG